MLIQVADGYIQIDTPLTFLVIVLCSWLNVFWIQHFEYNAVRGRRRVGWFVLAVRFFSIGSTGKSFSMTSISLFGWVPYFPRSGMMLLKISTKIKEKWLNISLSSDMLLSTQQMLWWTLIHYGMKLSSSATRWLSSATFNLNSQVSWLVGLARIFLSYTDVLVSVGYRFPNHLGIWTT